MENTIETTTGAENPSAVREIKIPSMFFFFLLKSGFSPLPKVKDMQGFNIWIDQGDQHLPRLIESAKDYCKAHNDDDGNAILRAAKRLLWAVGFYGKPAQEIKRKKRNHIFLKSAIESAAQIFAERGERKPSFCDVRCLINDLTAENSPRWHYNQEKAFRKVRNILAKS